VDAESLYGDGKAAGGHASTTRLGSYESKAQGRRKGKGGRWFEGQQPGAWGQQRFYWIPDGAGRPYKPREKVDLQTADEREPITEVESDFWHSGWAVRRDRVIAAMRAGGASPAAAYRFEHCGSRAWVWQKKDGSDVRVHADFCRNRHCVRCSAAVGRRVRATIEETTKGEATRLLTLTVPHNKAEPLRPLVSRLLVGFQALRRTEQWKKAVTGGCYVLEVKWNEDGGGWHPHLHVLLQGDYIDHNGLKGHWQRLTGCTGVRIELVRSREGIARYVARYVTKQIDASVYRDQERLIEALQTLQGTRMMGTFGNWRGVELQGEAEAFDRADWKPLCRLDDLRDLAVEGEAVASAIWWGLFGKPEPGSDGG